MSGDTRLDVWTSKHVVSLQLSPEDLSRPLSNSLRQRDLPLNTRCGGRGLCDGCVVELLAGRLIHAPSGRTVAAENGPMPVRGCEHWPAPHDQIVLRIPDRSLLAHEPQIVTEFRVNVSRAHAPLWRRDRFEGQPPPTPLGAAIDIGTTTVVVMLVDLCDGSILASASALNAQTHFGDNVLTRIQLCLSDPAMLARLQRAIAEQTIAPLIRQTLNEVGAAPEQLVCLTIAGNTTMLHLLAGADPSPMGTVPFTPAFLEHRLLRPDHIGLGAADAGAGLVVNARADVHLLPGAAAYVGADLMAGVGASGMVYRDETCMLVDIGTNGEIILHHNGELLGCATAAGPAFEGSGLSCGVRAGHGAVAHLRLDGNKSPLQVEVIGHTQPIGLCGTAYIDFLAEGRRAGLLSATGRLQAGEDNASLTTGDHGRRGFIIAHAQTGKALAITESDIAALLQAKAAIAAGIDCLLGQAGLRTSDVQTLYLAGGFGLHLNVANAIGCGLLPGFLAEQVELVGNTALAGAYLALMDTGALDAISRISRAIRIVELNLDPRFEEVFIDRLALP